METYTINNCTCCNQPLPEVKKPIHEPEKWAAEKEAFARGEKIQVQNVGEWINFVPKDKNDPPPWTGDYRFRIAPILVPLGPEDVKCGDEIRQSHWNHGVSVSVIGKNEKGVWWFNATGDFRFSEYGDLKGHYEISRDGKTWEACSK